ncbi:uncharacterized protein LOC128548171 [Mercenaria mercenaria]|uniref:uncharacterized protein LOC128548171 n=1 Tax=Mercenaria mercenaria TaxID=6596 RepID=UPI00234EBC31|nr:uncharacterized protein LOC128548171 [Mercenaria mercenaria]
MAEAKAGESNGPTNADIIAMLGKINLKLIDVDKKLESLESIQRKVEAKVQGLENKVDNFDYELKKLWLHVDSTSKATDSKIDHVVNRVSSTEIESEVARKRIENLEKKNVEMKESLTYMQSQSMRNNLIFGGIKEETNENPEKTETILRNFMVEKLQLARELVANMKIERVHRMGPPAQDQTERQTKIRRIVCKFNLFQDREVVRKSSHKLRSTSYYITEQFPPEIAVKRKSLFRKMKQEKEAGNTAWVSYDKLYVNGKVVSDA